MVHQELQVQREQVEHLVHLQQAEHQEPPQLQVLLVQQVLQEQVEPQQHLELQVQQEQVEHLVQQELAELQEHLQQAELQELQELQVLQVQVV